MQTTIKQAKGHLKRQYVIQNFNKQANSGETKFRFQITGKNNKEQRRTKNLTSNQASNQALG